jgi:pyruvate dehydrogenase E2 component (dihydrolipoamide acetyltransferase)
MPADITMPRLSDSMEEGTILRWLKSVGDEVKRGEDLVEIETDKANMTYESSEEGTLTEILAEEGDTLPIGEVIARVGEPGEAKADGRAAPAKEAKKQKKEPEAEREPAPEPSPSPARDRAPASAPPATRERPRGPSEDGRVKASPIARRMARELGVELGRLQGSGPGGRIVKADVVAAASRPPRKEPPAGKPADGFVTGRAPREPAPPAPEAPETAKGEVEVVELNRLQRTVARRMAESKATVPHFYLQMEIAMAQAVQVREQLKEIGREGAPVPTYNDMVVKACAFALREFPRANGAYRDGKVELYSRVNVGIAVAAQDALVVPTIFDADRKSLGEIAVEARELAGKVREGKVTPPELSGGTFTVSNLGMYGIDNFSAVINPPQAALLAVGAVERKPVVDEDSGSVVARHAMGVTLACDHRILYGADGAQFLGRVRELLEHPLAMAL